MTIITVVGLILRFFLSGFPCSAVFPSPGGTSAEGISFFNSFGTINIGSTGDIFTSWASPVSGEASSAGAAGDGDEGETPVPIGSAGMRGVFNDKSSGIDGV